VAKGRQKGERELGSVEGLLYQLGDGGVDFYGVQRKLLFR